MGCDEVIQKPDSLIERVGTGNKAQFGIVKQGFFAELLVEACRIGSVERRAGILQLVGLGVARCQIIGSVLCKDIVTARHLLQVGDGTLVVAFHHLADTHLIVGLTRNTMGQIFHVNLVVL